MSDLAAIALASTAPAALASFTLDYDIAVGGQVLHPAGTKITVRKPGAGELRGLTLVALGQGDYASLETIAPRITSPVLHKATIAAMDPADLMQLGSEVIDFLLPKAAKADFPTA